MNFLEAPRCSGSLHCEDFPSDRRIGDKRLPLLLVLLRELEQSVSGFEKLPESDLSEIIFAAIRVCGYIDPLDALQAVSTVLEVIEWNSPPRELLFGEQSAKAA